MRVVTGIQPTGRLHLGNYFGALAHFIRLQYQANEALLFLADLHALTTVHDAPRLRRGTLDLAIDVLALGVDVERTILFRQSDIPETVLFNWILAGVTPVSLLERAHAYKDKVAKGTPPAAALFTYPVLMSADILLFAADTVPVGSDQKQHLEFARDIATKFNIEYVPHYDPADPSGERNGTPGILRLPEALLAATAGTVPGIDGRKMSKSYGNTIDLFAPETAVRARIMRIKTDSTPVGDRKPEPHDLLTLLQLLCDTREYQDHLQSWRTGGVGYQQYKQRVVECFFDRFGEARRRRTELEREPQLVIRALREGADSARALAAPLWERIIGAVGVGGRLGRTIVGPELLLT